MSKSKRKTTGRRKARPTIAYLTTELYSHLGQWTGTVDAARKHDVNLITFPGASLHFPTGFDAQANILYELIDAETIDGLITWASAIGNFVTAEELQAFHERYRSLPMVTIGRTLEGIPSLLMDSYEGMREAIEHMIGVHGYRRLAFIRGPEAHLYAQERYRAYTEALEVHGITLDLKMVTPPAMWGRATGMEMMQLLLDERNLLPQADIEAVVAASDDILLGALDVLQARGIRVPTDMAIAGFDDRVEGRTTTPPLTSVAAPFYDVGYQAVETLLALMAGKQIPEEVTVPSKLVVRQSCGCSNPAVMQAVAELPPAVDRVEVSKTELEAALVAQRTEIAAAMVQAAEELGGKLNPGWAGQLLDGLAVELGRESAGAFLDALDEVLRQISESADDIAAMQNAVSTLRRSTLPYLDGETLPLAENLWQQARVLIGETMQRMQAREQLQAEQRAASLRDLGAALITTFDLEDLMDVLAEGLPRVGIPRAYLSLYEEPQPYTYPQPAPEWSRLILAYGEVDEKRSSDDSGSERIKLEAGGRRFRSRRLVPEGLLPQDRQYSLAVQSLYLQQNQIGFVLFEVGPQEGGTPDVLSTQISSALQGTRILEDLDRERNLLHTMIDNLPDYIYVKDREGRFIMGNTAVLRQMEVASLEELVGKSDFDFFPQELAERYYAEEQEIIQSEQGLYNYEGPTVDQGEERWVSTTKVPLRDPQGKVFGFVGLGRDLTARKQTELALQRRALQLQTAAEVSHAASGMLDLDALIQQVVDLVRERFELYYVGLFLVGEEGSAGEAGGKWAVLRAGTGEAGRQMIAQGHKLEVGGTSMIGACVANKQARIALDVGEEAVRFDNPFLPETRSELALPLVSHGEAIGALTIQSTQEAAFSDEDVTVLQTMADQLANAIANARLYRALAQEQYLLGALLDSTPDHIYFKDTESRFIRASRSQTERFGLDAPADVVGMIDFDFFTEEHARPAYEDEQRIIRTGEPVLGLEEKETWTDGSVSWVSTSKMPLRDEEGEIIGTFGISSDITARKQAELALQRRALQLQTAAEVSRAASSILDPDELIQQVVDLVRERFELYYVGLFLVGEEGSEGEPGGKWAVLRAGTGEAGRQMLEQRHRLEVGGGSMIGLCITTKAARIALDVGEEAVRFDNPFLPETRSELALPLVSRGEAIGALTIQSAQEAAFSDEDVTVLQTMADQLANAIANARLFDRAQTQANEMGVLSELAGTLSSRLTVQEVLDEVHQGACRLLDATNFYIALYDPDTHQVSFPFDTTQEEGDRFLTLSADQGITGYIIRNRTSVLIEEDVTERLAEMGVSMVGEPALSWLGVPMMIGDQVLGVMGVQNFTTPRAYDEHDRDLLTALATQVASALTNARLFEQTQAALAEVEATQRRYLERGWSEYAQTQRISGYEQAGAELVPLDDALLPEVRQAMKEQRTIVLEDDDGASVMVVPVMLRGQSLGAVGFKLEGEGRSWSADDIALVEGVSEQFALAAENIRLLDETQRRAARERLTRDITDKMRRAASINDIVQTAVDELFGALRTSRTFVRLGVTPSPQDDGGDKEESQVKEVTSHD